MRDRIFFLVSDHSFGYFQDDWVKSERSPLKHAYLFVKVYQVRLVKFVFIDLVQEVPISLVSICEKLLELGTTCISLRNDLLSDNFPLLGLIYFLIKCFAKLHEIVHHVLGYLNRPFRVAKSFLVPVQLA